VGSSPTHPEIRRRFATEGGARRLHTCYHGATGAIAPECNERAAQNALEHGVAFGALAAPMVYTSPNQVIWYSSWEADCWGLNRLPSDLKVLPHIAPCVKSGDRRNKDARSAARGIGGSHWGRPPGGGLRANTEDRLRAPTKPMSQPDAAETVQEAVPIARR
jgi:hypothetical protein